jgi:hypothetical protein
MNNTPIECPKCHHKFAISEAIQHEHDEAILNQGIEQGKSQALNEIQPSLAAKDAVIAASPNRELGLLKEVEQLRVAQSSMEKQLRDAFSLDKIEPVKTGENGADVAHMSGRLKAEIAGLSCMRPSALLSGADGWILITPKPVDRSCRYRGSFAVAIGNR